MGTKAIKRRMTEDISRLSAETRLKAWAAFTELIREGADQNTALRKALRQACPPENDPYYAIFYSNKMRELERWRRRGLWPLAKPKDIEHDTALHDTVEVSTEALDNALSHGEGMLSPLFLSSDDPGEDEGRVDTLEFDPVEVAKIIESYEQNPALFAAVTEALVESCAQDDMESDASEGSYAGRAVRLKARAPRSQLMDPVMEAESERIVQEFFESVGTEDSRLESSPGELSQPVSSHAHPCAALDQATLDELLTMLAWWKQHTGLPPASQAPLPMRPDFSHERLVTKRITMDAQLWAEAEKVAKEQKELSGGTLSGLLEFLVWRHLGSSHTHLKQ